VGSTNCLTQTVTFTTYPLSISDPSTLVLLSKCSDSNLGSGGRSLRRGCPRSLYYTMAAIEQIDLEMTEDPVIPTTEIVRNGRNGATIDPSKLSILASPPNMISPKLPFHGVSSPVKTFSTSRLSLARNQPNNHAIDSSSGTDSDVMDITPSRSTNVQVRIPPAPRFPLLPYSSSKTGLVYDERMKFHADNPELISNEEQHPEDPNRISAIYDEIWQAGLVQGPNDPIEKAHEDQCWWIHSRPATSAEICLIHTPEHYNFIESLQRTLAE
jgi:histone deacetylase 6